MAKYALPSTGSRDPRLDGAIIHYADVSMVINDDDGVDITLAGTGDQELIPPTGYTTVTGYAEAAKIGSLLSVTGGKCVIGTLPSGDWIIKGDGYLDPSHSSNPGAHVGVVFGLTRGGSTTLTQRAVHARLPSQNDIGNICGRGTITGVQSGDEIDVRIASDISGTVTVHTSNVNFSLHKVES